jgi:hypothetical protein
MSYSQACPVCRAPILARSGAGANTSEIHCPRCGRYHIQALAETQLTNGHPAFPPMHLLSGLCRNTWDLLADKVLITVDLFTSWAALDALAKIAIPRDTDLKTKGEYLLKFLRRKSKSLADVVTFTPNELAVGFCANKNELLFCLQYLEGHGWIEADSSQTKNQQAFAFRLTPAGWSLLDTPTSPAQPTAVVCLPHDKDAEALWSQGFSAALAAINLKAVRADTKESANKITDDLIVEIRRATCVVADLTTQNPLIYFQAGLALGLGKPVFWTCEASELNDKKLQLELRQHVVTTWSRDKIPELANRLAVRIEATLGGVSPA